LLRRSVQRLVLKTVLVLLVLVVAGVVVYWFVIEPHMRFERLELFSFYGWTVNSAGEVRQVTFVLFNNGTKELTVSEVWINGTLMSPTEWGCYFGRTLEPRTGERFFIAPKGEHFINGSHYNFTIGTSSGNHFSFTIRVDEESIKPENLTIIDCNFGHLPQSGIPGEYFYVGLRVRNFGDTPVIVTKVKIDGITFDKKEWIFPHTLDSVIIDYRWRVGNYVIQIETAAGNIYHIIATAEYP